MAKRKKSSRKRARRVGAMSLNPNSSLMKLAAVAAGYFLADQINPAIDSATKSFLPAPVTTTVPATATAAATSTVTNKSTPMILSGVELGIGALLLMKKRASWLTVVPGGILAGAGLKRALKTAGVVSGYQSVPVIGRRGVRGYQSTPVLAGVPNQLTGVPNQLTGYRVNGRNSGYTPNGSGAMGIMNGVGNGSGITGDNASGYMG